MAFIAHRYALIRVLPTRMLTNAGLVWIALPTMRRPKRALNDLRSSPRRTRELMSAASCSAYGIDEGPVQVVAVVNQPVFSQVNG